MILSKSLIVIIFFIALSGSSIMLSQSNRNIENPNLWQDFTYDIGVAFGGVGYVYTGNTVGFKYQF